MIYYLCHDILKFIKAKKETNALIGNYIKEGNTFKISTQPATDLSTIPSNSIDYCFTDPPYGGSVQYLDLSTIWNAWLQFDVDYANEMNLLNIRWGFLMKSRKNTIATQIKQIYHNLLSKYNEIIVKNDVTPRVSIEHANTIYHNVLAILAELTNVTNIVTARITAEHANTIYCDDLDKVSAELANLTQTVVSSRLIFVSANTNHCEELIYPKEFMNDTLPPVITDISVINLTNNSAKVTWITDEFADSVVKYGVNSTEYTEIYIDELFVKDHEITLTGLLPGTTYYFVVNSTDQSGNSAEISEYSFKYNW